MLYSDGCTEQNKMETQTLFKWNGHVRIKHIELQRCLRLRFGLHVHDLLLSFLIRISRRH